MRLGNISRNEPRFFRRYCPACPAWRKNNPTNDARRADELDTAPAHRRYMV
jgi:hypothetical protein